MLKLELPFHLTECARESFFVSSLAELRQPKPDEVTLESLSISIETGGKTYAVISNGCPQADSVGPFLGTVWPRWLLPLSDEISVEQKMVLPAGGNAIAISWRSIGRALPARLKVSSLFSAQQPFSGVGFEIEPETNGGRLAWRPHDHSAKIIADTNGCFVGKATPSDFDSVLDLRARSGVVPASFEFDLGPRPAVLIFSAEPRIGAGADPLIGAFLAQLAEQRTAVTD